MTKLRPPFRTTDIARDQAPAPPTSQFCNPFAGLPESGHGAQFAGGVTSVQLEPTSEQDGLPPGAVYPAGLRPCPHPSRPPFDAAPPTGAWTVRAPRRIIALEELAQGFKPIRVPIAGQLRSAMRRNCSISSSQSQPQEG